MELKVKKTYEITANIMRTVKEGVECRLSPSYGCLDIIPGIVEIIQVGTQEEMDAPQYDFESWKLNPQKDPYWVKYVYVYGEHKGHEDILPLSEFVDHMSAA